MDIMDVLLSAKLNKNSDGSSGTTNYNQLTNKPKINNIELSGNKTLTDLGIAARSDIPEIPVSDVQIDGTSILSNGVANIKKASTTTLGAIMIGTGLSIGATGILRPNGGSASDRKAGTNMYIPTVMSTQHESTFYGLAKAAGDTTMPSSSNAVGTYTEEAKNAIRAMLGVTDSAGGMNVVTLTGTNITQTAAENTMYKCGELAELTFTAPASGITAVRFSSGSTPTVASFPGVTWLGDFDPDNLISNVTYEINILDGVGVAGWA